MITGCRFSLSVMSDNYANLILNAIKDVDTKNVWSNTDALSTVYRGRRVHIIDNVKNIFVKVNDGKTHITLEATFSKGCPCDVDGDYILAESDELLTGNAADFYVLGKISFYPLGTTQYMEHIAAVVDMARECKVYKKHSHYASEIEGDVNEIFDYFNQVLSYAEENITHYVFQVTLSVNSPSLN